ncbi:Roadblock/LC7 domain containing protein [Trichomonas vaginalis G3]|uniref:Roadblock/LC7 domain containing protein n=1 Tax=Trichomonas vaginalis (strain ATCC PRA-98 / G3) TaxID=412133 RepID=A2ENF6_TRIV3|nr:dynein intermediate chain binding [Trichomonas vaginalis G3]EAY05826.1 Roadblock/LC7 domain containing protein [Trichomonas vaginalis G3]KAI5516377.1 dynein intermediate chain binding [Trichomonas vaginalis G3]|eukprot:XP_001318049.1 Roadblock/LC7 domain containing protein [Trichomonas vaginalis G3]
MSSEIDGILKNLATIPGVTGWMVLKMNGLPYKTSLREAESVHYAGLVSEFVKKAKTTLENSLLPGAISQIRVRSHKNEIIIVPDNDFILVAIQDAAIPA